MSSLQLSSILDRKVCASDGEVGTIHDMYFCDDTWFVEHAVLKTGSYFERRHLIMDPRLILAKSGHDSESLPADIYVAATRQEILASPDYLTDPPVSEQRAHDPALHPRFLWFPKGDASKIVLRPLGAGEAAVNGEERESLARKFNPNLRSFRELRGYAVYPDSMPEEEETAETSRIGHVVDLLLRSENLKIERILVDSDHGASEILSVPPDDVKNIDWMDVQLNLRRSRVELGLPVG